MNSTIVAILQGKLNSAGYNPGPQDGALGRRTYTALFNYMAGRDLEERGVLLGRGAAAHFSTYGISEPLRIAHWMGQMAHETMKFTYLHELWGPTAAQDRYEERHDLGNNQPGDGKRYKGRGLIQLTGRANYNEYGRELGLDLINEPELAEDPEVAVLIACAYWKRLGLNQLANADDIVSITHRINGGENGLASRRELLARAKGVLL